MRRRFELADGATRKFWEIETVEDTYVTWRGIVGEAEIEVREQTRSSRYCAEFDGSRRTEAAIYRKLRRGYVEVYGDAPLVDEHLDEAGVGREVRMDSLDRDGLGEACRARGAR